MEQDRGGAGREQVELFPGLLDELEGAVAAACGSRETWPERVGAGIYAGVDFAIDHPVVIDALAAMDRGNSAPGSEYVTLVERLAALISRDAPTESRLPG